MRSPLLLLLLISFLPAGSAQEGQTFFMLHMQEYQYLPATLEVPAGAEVVAMNFGPANQSLPKDQWGEFYHTVTSSTDRSLFDVQQIPPDTSPYPFRAPSTPGTYPFYCVYHGDAQGNGMVGTLIVTEANMSVTPTGTPTATPTATGTQTGGSPSPEPGANGAPLGAWVSLAACGAAALLLRRR